MKTGAWLRGGRGKIAGMVAQKSSDGKGTVLRELVTPSNPQTVDQMATRLAFGTVTQAAAMMLPIIGQTFKGQGDEKSNRRRFVALNVPLLKAEAQSQENGSAVGGVFRGKSSAALLPNPYIISEGSLQVPGHLQIGISETTGRLTGADLSGREFTFVNGQSYNPAEVLAELFGVDVNDQITICTINVLGNAMTGYVDYQAADSGDFVRSSIFYGRRIVFNTDAASFTYTTGMQDAALKSALLAGFDIAKSSEGIVDLFDDMIISEATVSIDVQLFSPMKDDEEEIQVAGALFISRLVNGKWDYSTTKMAFVKPTGTVGTTNNSWWGLTFNNALVDYLGAQAASKLYTRKGGLINDI